ncbi:glyoxylate/hydroxypyruvate reductase A [Acinetobacter baumannii]|nr:glyoxylate/hydroxypyruvate reductase A [Acinetobacter baumannii]
MLDELDEETRKKCDVAIVANPDPNDLKKLPELQWVHSVWAGVDKLVTELNEQYQIKIVRLIDPKLSDTMSEAVLAWTLYLHRNMPLYAKQQSERKWLEHEYTPPEEKTISILGLGALGSISALKLKAAGFNVCGWSRTQKNIPNITCYSGSDGLSDMLKKTDILICLLPLTPQTQGLINQKMIQSLRKNSSIINFSRGLIIDDLALREELNNGHLEHVVLDVFDIEPLSPESWHWQHEKVTVLPHISAPTNRKSASLIVAENIRKYRLDGSIPPFINKMIGY